MNDSKISNFHETFGKRIRFTAHDNGDSLSVGVIEGLCIAVESTTGGAFRLSIRTDKPAPQGGGNIEWRAYSNLGDVEYLDPQERRWKQHHDDCPVCKTRLSSHSPNGFDKIFECQAPAFMHHRHMIRGITGEYITMRPLTPTEIARR